jgi:electron transfer flavoprotein alpha/beta subunit
VGPQTAARLDLPLVTGVYSLTGEDSVLTVERRMDEYIEKYKVRLPAALTIHPSGTDVRDSTLTGIEAAFVTRGYESLSLSDLGLSRDKVGETGSPTKVVSMSRISRKRKCEFIAGPAEEQVDKLVSRLKESGHIG